MEKIREIYSNSRTDYDSLLFVFEVLNQFPTEKGYRVEAFFSPKFVRVSVYKEDNKDVK